MKILFAIQGPYGERIARNVAAHGPADWETAILALPARLPAVIDDPDGVLPAAVPPADLLVSLHETQGGAELIPDIAERCGARAVLAAVDDRAACPPGLENQLRRRLGAMGIPCAFPAPLCGFEGAENPELSAFAARFGRPSFRIGREGDRVAAAGLLRDTPCGAGRFIAEGLPGERTAEAAAAGALRHHHDPCLASMTVEPGTGDTLMHAAGFIARAALRDAVDRGDG